MNSPFKDGSSLIFSCRASLLFGAWEDEATSARAILLLEFSNKTSFQGMTRLFQGPRAGPVFNWHSDCSSAPATVYPRSLVPFYTPSIHWIEQDF